MRSYERSGITVDQCAECRGIFLDRGELERLVDAETSWHGQSAAPQQAPPPPQQDYGQPQYGGHQQYGRQGYGKPHKKRKSFMEELFD